MKSIKEKVSDVIIEKQKDKDFKDTSVIEFTRKYQAQYDIITFKDLDDIEKDPITAFKLIEKNKIWPPYNVQELKDAGLPAGVVFLSVKIRESLGSKPADSQKARELYMESIDDLKSILSSAKNVIELKDTLYEFYQKWGKLITEALIDKSRFSFRSPDYIDNKTIDSVWGKRFVNQIKFASESAKEVFLLANKYNPLSQREADDIRQFKIKKATDRVSELNESLYQANIAGSEEELRGVFNKHYYSYSPGRSLEENKKYFTEYLTPRIASFQKDASNPTIKSWELPRDEDWSWADVKKSENKLVTEKDEWSNSIESLYGITKPFKPTALDYIKRTQGLPIPDITVESIREHFGYSEVVFGNYVKNNESKEHVRHFLGGMLDLAELLNVNIKQINQLGGLSIFFGALGCGSNAAMACYYPTRKAINLTKKTGDGTLAHEWSHYLDNVSGEKEEVRNDPHYGTLGYAYLDNVNIKQAFSEINNAIKKGIPHDITLLISGFKSDKYPKFRLYGTTAEECVEAIQRKYPRYKDYNYLMDNKEAVSYYRFVATKFGLEKISVTTTVTTTKFYFISSRYGKRGYWDSPKELFARAFEAYIEDKLEKKGRHSNYLVSITNNLGLNSLIIPQEEWPYPYGLELEVISDAFDNLIKVLKQEFNIADFSWFSDVRQDEYIDLAPTKDEKTEAGVIITEKEEVKTIDATGKMEIKNEQQELPEKMKQTLAGIFKTSDTIIKSYIEEFFDQVEAYELPGGKFEGRIKYTGKKGDFILVINPTKEGWHISLGRPGLDMSNIQSFNEYKSWFPETTEEVSSAIIEANDIIINADILRKKLIEKYSKTEESDPEEGIDLFEYVEDLPEEVRNLIQSKAYDDDMEYQEISDFREELEKLGFTFEYDLGGTLFGLKKMDPQYYKMKVDGIAIEREFKDGKNHVTLRKDGNIVGLVYPTVIYPNYISNKEAIEKFKEVYPEKKQELEHEKTPTQTIDVVSAEIELAEYKKLAQRLYQKKYDLKETIKEFLSKQHELASKNPLSKNTQDYFSKEFGTDDKGNLLSMENAAENFIVRNFPEYKTESSEKDYFTEKLKAIKIALRFANEEDKVYFSQLSKAIKIALKYL